MLCQNHHFVGCIDPDLYSMRVVKGFYRGDSRVTFSYKSWPFLLPQSSKAELQIQLHCKPRMGPHSCWMRHVFPLLTMSDWVFESVSGCQQQGTLLSPDVAAHAGQVTQDNFGFGSPSSLTNHCQLYRFWELNRYQPGIKGSRRER